MLKKLKQWLYNTMFLEVELIHMERQAEMMNVLINGEAHIVCKDYDKWFYLNPYKKVPSLIESHLMRLWFES